MSLSSESCRCPRPRPGEVALGAAVPAFDDTVAVTAAGCDSSSCGNNRASNDTGSNSNSSSNQSHQVVAEA